MEGATLSGPVAAPAADGRPRPNELRRFAAVAVRGYEIGLAIHVVFVPVFWHIGADALALFNIGSVALFSAAVVLHRRGWLQTGMWIVATEATTHALLATWYLGLASGFHYHLLTLAFTSFLLPFYSLNVRLLMGAASFLLTLALVAYATLTTPPYPPPPGWQLAFHLTNLAAFGSVLGAIVATYASVVDVAERALEAAYAKSEALLLNILPAAIAERLKERPGTIADRLPEVTILFADIVGFTPLAERLPADRLILLLDEVISRFDELADRFGLEKIKTVGDAYMAVAGAPVPRPDHAEAAADLALAMREEVAAWHDDAGRRLQLRIGIESGSVVAGVIGRRKFAYDLWGDTVNTAARMESHGPAGEIQVGPVAHARLNGKYVLAPRGAIEIKGKGTMGTWLLQGPKSPS
jgi:class 3 adenylate cyclase